MVQVFCTRKVQIASTETLSSRYPEDAHIADPRSRLKVQPADPRYQLTGQVSRATRTAPHSTSLHRFQAAGIFYPNFYPKGQRSGIETPYLLVTAANWDGRPECVTSLPSRSCGFDYRRPLQFVGFFRFRVSACPRFKSSIGSHECQCDVSPA